MDLVRKNALLECTYAVWIFSQPIIKYLCTETIPCYRFYSSIPLGLTIYTVSMVNMHYQHNAYMQIIPASN